MRIGTWNVEHATSKAKNQARLERLRGEDCDVWVLTETHDDLDLGPEYRAVRTSPQAGAPPGARWTTIWSRLPIVQEVALLDSDRTVAAILTVPGGQLLVYGTVLPWHADKGSTRDASNWAEHYRVLEAQGREWVNLRERYPGVLMCVAGDLNMSLGGKHFYGTGKGRTLLRLALDSAGLKCATETERVTAGWLRDGPIDHVCVSASLATSSEVVAAWEGTTGGVRLSDHSGLAVEIMCPQT